MVSKCEIYRELREIGIDSFPARLTASVLEYADDRHKTSHGRALLKNIRQNFATGLISGSLRLRLYRRSRWLSVIDGGKSIGYAAMSVAMRYGVAAAQRNGSCLVGVDCIDHIGAAGFYAREGALRGMITIVVGSGKPRLPIFGTYMPLFGTTPIAIGIPAHEEPVVADLALARYSVNRLLEMRDHGELCGAGAGWDTQGAPTQNPNELLKGCLSPIGDHKGSALAMAIALLIGGAVAVDEDGNHPVLLAFLKSDEVVGFNERVASILYAAEDVVASTPSAHIPGRRR